MISVLLLAKLVREISDITIYRTFTLLYATLSISLQKLPKNYFLSLAFLQPKSSKNHFFPVTSPNDLQQLLVFLKSFPIILLSPHGLHNKKNENPSIHGIIPHFSTSWWFKSLFTTTRRLFRFLYFTLYLLLLFYLIFVPIHATSMLIYVMPYYDAIFLHFHSVAIFNYTWPALHVLFESLLCPIFYSKSCLSVTLLNLRGIS